MTKWTDVLTDGCQAIAMSFALVSQLIKICVHYCAIEKVPYMVISTHIFGSLNIYSEKHLKDI